MENESVASATEDRFGRRVRSEREKRGWTQADLASRLSEFGLNLHPSAIAKIELRDVERPRAIRLDEAEVIARAFGLTVDEMYESPEHRVLSLGSKIGLFVSDLEDVVSKGKRLQNELVALLESAPKVDQPGLSAMLSVSAFIETINTCTQVAGLIVDDTIDRSIRGLPANENLIRMLPPSRFKAYRETHNMDHPQDDSAEA